MHPELHTIEQLVPLAKLDLSSSIELLANLNIVSGIPPIVEIATCGFAGGTLAGITHSYKPAKFQKVSEWIKADFSTSLILSLCRSWVRLLPA